MIKAPQYTKDSLSPTRLILASMVVLEVVTDICDIFEATRGNDGAIVGLLLGKIVGRSDLNIVGDIVGSPGLGVGKKLGLILGVRVGRSVGLCDVGRGVGMKLGELVFCKDGEKLGCEVGCVIGSNDGCKEG